MARLSDKALTDRYALIRTNITYLIKHSGKNIDETAAYLSICSKSLRKRLKDPKQFTLDDLDKLSRLYNVTLDKLLNGKPTLVVEMQPATIP
jgi:hypothetical protein